MNGDLIEKVCDFTKGCTMYDSNGYIKEYYKPYGKNAKELDGKIDLMINYFDSIYEYGVCYILTKDYYQAYKLKNDHNYSGYL